MASGFKILVVFMPLLATVSCVEVADEALCNHESSKFEKQDKFAFAKRHDYEDITNYDKKAVRFNSPVPYMRNFAFARLPYFSFA